MPITIRAARSDEAHRLTEIACRAKAHWGYSADQIACWREAFLTVTPAYINAHSLWVAADDMGEAVAFVAIEQRKSGPVMEHLWVLPTYMGRGIGKRLFLNAARQTPEFTFTSDPNADDFYLKLGARKVGELESDYQGRRLTLFRFRATAD